MHLPERNSDGTLPAYAWPGGYPIIYIDTHCDVLCASCATKALDAEDTTCKPVACEVFYEGPIDFCAECNTEIESAYGDPNASV
jgi:hypothetical protein